MVHMSRASWYLLLLFVASAAIPPVRAEPAVYLDESDFLDALSALDQTALHEGFEDEAAWGTVRSTVPGGSFTAPGIAHQGMVWAANNLTSEITTGGGPARTGDWGFYSLPHGSYSAPDPGTDCFVPGDCGDGWRGSAQEGELVAIGGWITTNTPYAKLGLYLDEYPARAVDFGETCDPPESEKCVSNDIVDTSHRFWGVIDVAGFASFEFRELEGKLEIGGGDLKYIFADDFWFSFRNSGVIFKNGFE